MDVARLSVPHPSPPHLPNPKDLQDILRSGFEDFAEWVNPVAAARARLLGEPVHLLRVLDGETVVDAEGRIYQDFLSGYGTQALGHRNERIAAALRAFLDSDAPSFFSSGISPYAGRFGRLLGERTGYGSVSLASSGTEAIESALKLARAATGKKRILGLEGAYHGCTFGSLSLMEKGPFRDPFGPHVQGIETLPFGDVAALARALDPSLGGGDVAAVVVEPIQVESGVRILPEPYTAALAELCPQHGVLIIADEVQTGLCRTGRFLASERWPRRPDMVVLAKALGGGLMPLSATLAQRDVFRRAYGSFGTAESHQYTFAGNALSCVAGMEALELLTGELAARVAEVGEAFVQSLRAALAGLPLVDAVRGSGLLVGIALKDADHPWLDFAALGVPELTGKPSMGLLLCHRLFRRGYLVHVAGHEWHVVRLQPPLHISAERLADFVTACREEVESLCQLL